MNLIPFGVSVAIGAIATIYPIWKIRKLNKLIKEIVNTKNTAVSNLTTGNREIEGNATQTSAGALISPISKTPCFYYTCSVTETIGSGKSRRYIVLVNENKSIPFFVDDQSGKVIVDPAGAEVIATKVNTFNLGGLLRSPNQALVDFLDSRNIHYKGFLGFKKDITCVETIIPFGEKVFVKGNAREYLSSDTIKLTELTDNMMYVPRNLETPTLIAVGGENVAVKQYKNRIIFLIAIILLIALLFGLISFILLMAGIGTNFDGASGR